MGWREWARKPSVEAGGAPAGETVALGYYHTCSARFLTVSHSGVPSSACPCPLIGPAFWHLASYSLICEPSPHSRAGMLFWGAGWCSQEQGEGSTLFPPPLYPRASGSKLVGGEERGRRGKGAPETPCPWLAVHSPFPKVTKSSRLGSSFPSSQPPSGCPGAWAVHVGQTPHLALGLISRCSS